MTFPLRLAGASLLAMTLALVAPIAQAATVTVNLDNLVLADGDVIQTKSAGYGSSGPVTLNWAPRNVDNEALRHWNGDYSGRDAAYCLNGVSCALDLTVAAGFSVSLDSFRLGGYPNTNLNVTWSVIDLLTDMTVASADQPLVSGSTGLTNTVGATSTKGFRIFFGPDGFNGGINDITYSYARVVNPPPPPPTVPLPAAGWMLLAGIGGLAALRRRRA